jgi:hypothetical protein
LLYVLGEGNGWKLESDLNRSFETGLIEGLEVARG